MEQKITFKISAEKKEKAKKLAQDRGFSLATFCRSILLENLVQNEANS